MVERRHVIGGGVLGGLLGALGADAAEAGQSSSSNREEAQVVARAIDGLRQEVSRQREDFNKQRIFTELAQIRELQLRYLVGNGKFPDFVEVGTDMWFQVHDWHIRWNQPLNLGRDIQNRPTLTVFQTTLIMRPELKDFIGIPYDNK